MGSSEYIETAKLAVTDGLTGVYNHRYFQERLRRMIGPDAEGRADVSLLMIDIDFFKKYNDANGHVAGDVALREVASRLARCLSREDVLARYGGEEFTIILRGKSKAEALEMAERLREEVRELPVANEKELPGGRLTISIGVATFPDDASDRGGLIDWADLSLYLAKTGGRNRVVSCPVDRRMAERETANLEATLRNAGPGGRVPASGGQAPGFTRPRRGSGQGGADATLGRRVHVVDIGEGGLAVAGEDLPPSGRRVEVILSGEGLDGEIALRGRVAWRRPESRLGEIVGIQFTAVAAKTANRLLRWVSERKGEKKNSG
jgi:diguanylate cyclase (GGDEF)-like protein